MKPPLIPPELHDQFMDLDNQLSPENLTCDGELSASRVKAKRAKLMKQWKALEAKVGFQVDFSLLSRNERRLKGQLNHYEWLEENFFEFLKAVGGNPDICGGIVGAHGDKAYCYDDLWEKAGIPFPHGVAIYFLSHLKPWSEETRDKDGGNSKVDKWVVENYARFKPHLPPVTSDYKHHLPPVTSDYKQRA